MRAPVSRTSATCALPEKCPLLLLTRTGLNRLRVDGRLRRVLPRLRGSAREVARAVAIRERMLKEAEDYVADMTAVDDSRKALIADFREAIGRLRERGSAQYWTDNRNTPIEDVLFREAYLLPRPRSVEH